MMSIDNANFIPLPNPGSRMHNNPATWLQEMKDRVTEVCTPTLHEKTLYVLGNAIALLTLAQMRQQLVPDEVSATLRQLRAVRAEYLEK